MDNINMDQPQNMPPADSGNNGVVIGIITLAVVAVAGLVWWQVDRFTASTVPTASPSATAAAALDQDTRSDLQAIDNIDTSNLDAEFDSIDRNLNQL